MIVHSVIVIPSKAQQVLTVITQPLVPQGSHIVMIVTPQLVSLEQDLVKIVGSVQQEVSDDQIHKIHPNAQ